MCVFSFLFPVRVALGSRRFLSDCALLWARLGAVVGVFVRGKGRLQVSQFLPTPDLH